MIKEEHNIVSHVYKGGRCFNGAHRDAGTIVHIINGSEPNGFWGGKSLCGARPGMRGYGWAPTKKDVNCEKCLLKQESIKR